MNLEKAVEIQLKLSARLRLKWEERHLEKVAGADFSYDRAHGLIGASVVVMRLQDFEVIETAQVVREVRFPYIPGFLAFREAPSFFDAFRKIRERPDVTLVDGNGIAHPRRMGLASFVGVAMDICTIGCAKSPTYDFTPPSKKRGEFTFFRNEREEKVGVCLRTREGVKPVFVSPGHRIDFQESVRIVLLCSKFRIPEPLRKAHLLANRLFTPE
ncbi:MAG: endonuclease V [Candidatus Aminicenantales bacterium]